MIEDIVVALIRAAASQYRHPIRQFWLFGADEKTQKLYAAASLVCYPKKIIWEGKQAR